MNEDKKGCVACDRLDAELDDWIETAERSLPEKIPGHGDQPAASVVTGIILRKTIERALEEIGNPLHLLAVLQREVMRGCRIEVISLATDKDHAAPNEGRPAPISDSELLNLAADEIGNA